ncbi:MAG: alpha/beta hydrolase, partial [Bacteroidota bacterium]
MRTIFILSFLIHSILIHAQNQPIEGNWKGFLEFGGNKMDIQISFEKEDDGWTGSLSSQKQQLDKLIITNINKELQKLQFDVPLAGGRWSGTINGDSLKGKWLQAGHAIPLDFVRTDKKATVEVQYRKQTPRAPFPYEIREIDYYNEKDQTKLAGTLTIPKGDGPFPAAILLSVAGPNDRDQTFGSPQHKPFLVLADYLTKNGIVVLRSDDRGVGASGGNLYESTLHDFALDAQAAFNLLKKLPEIDSMKIGFIGNSEGTLVGPLATSYGCNSAFIITLGGIGIHGSEVILDQVESIGDLTSISEEEMEKMKKGTQKMFSLFDQERDREVIKQKLKSMLEKNDSNASKELFLLPQSIDQQAELFSSPWYRYQVQHDAGKVLQQITCPFLALHGNRDPFVSADKNLKAIADNLSIAGNQDYTVRKFNNI